jgi:hypothetical protein
MGLVAAVAAIRDELAQDATLAPLVRSDTPPDRLPLPGMVVYAAGGALRPVTLEGRWDGVHTIAIEIHVARADMGYVPLVQARVIGGYGDNRFGGTCVLVGTGPREGGSAPLRYQIAQDDWNGVATLSLTHELDVLTEEN